jgi:hypothetical protein
MESVAHKMFAGNLGHRFVIYILISIKMEFVAHKTFAGQLEHRFATYI